MAKPEDLSNAVASIESPLIVGRSLGELDLVSSVTRSLTGKAKVELRLPVPDTTRELDRRLIEALKPLVNGVDVDVEVMSESDAKLWIGRLKEMAGPAIGEPGSTTRVVAVSSGKGGVGKSSVSANLAVVLARTGRRVGIVDGDIWGFSIPAMLGIAEPPYMVGEMIVPPVAHRVKVMSMDYFVPEDKAVIWRGPMLHKAVEQFLKDVFWDDLDFLIVDMPPGTGDISISMSQFLPRAQVLLVTTPQPTAQRVARRAGLMAGEVDQEVIGVVENMSWFTGDDGTRYELFGSGGGAALADELGVDLMGQIPLLPAMGRGADLGQPAILAAPGSEAATAFEHLADAVIAKRPRVRSNPALIIK
ncbi:MAG: Mrp/NBP35 family ATP-binding protein [Actinobacteria bacterium]|nr:Mrp/NBP35 family ATP-binding protein [Actinomycetota bacterium]MCI0543217.1 Mrp/NBP35 family ATP-binding protein [Actinomycetota bacterium]MCI0677817.1 Mrp/NBP35 family ATP-binding protein [Actinomycetota bacterium]